LTVSPTQYLTESNPKGLDPSMGVLCLVIVIFYSPPIQKRILESSNPHFGK